MGTGARAARHALHRHAEPAVPKEGGLRERKGLVEAEGYSQPCQGYVPPTSCPRTTERHQEKPWSKRQSRGVGLAVPYSREKQPGIPSWRGAEAGCWEGADLYFGHRAKLPHPIGHLRRLGEELTCGTAREGTERAR